MPKPTISDVAREAGVSLATVSRAMRGFTNVAPQTRKRVLEVADRLRYSPDPNASRLATGKTGTIGVLVASLDVWYSSQMVAGIEAVVAAEGLETVVFAAYDQPTRARVLLGSLGRRCDGLVSVDVSINPTQALALEIPWVLVGAKTPLTDAIFIDNHAGAGMATNHLIEHGHTRIGLISGMSDRLGNRVTEDRREGFIQAMERAGLAYDAALDFPGEFSAPGGFEAMENLLKHKKPPTAVWSMSDEMAFGAIRCIKERGLLLPGDISLIGFDEHDLAFTHGLTTIAQRPADLGAEAVRLLLHRIADPATPSRELRLPLELIRRDSVARPA